MQCSYCYGGFKSAHTPLTAPCGHVFHEDCARTLSIGRRGLSCPECDEEPQRTPRGETPLWKTFWEAGEAGCSQSNVGEDGGGGGGGIGLPPPPPLACWRRVGRLEVSEAELSRVAEVGRQGLAQDRAQSARLDEAEASLRGRIAAARAELERCRSRSFEAVVRHGAARCARQLARARGDEEVEAVLRAQLKAHGGALPELHAVQAQVLGLLQASYADRLRALASARDRLERGKREAARAASSNARAARDSAAPRRRDVSGSARDGAGGGWASELARSEAPRKRVRPEEADGAVRRGLPASLRRTTSLPAPPGRAKAAPSRPQQRGGEAQVEARGEAQEAEAQGEEGAGLAALLQLMERDEEPAEPAAGLTDPADFTDASLSAGEPADTCQIGGPEAAHPVEPPCQPSCQPCEAPCQPCEAPSQPAPLVERPPNIPAGSLNSSRQPTGGGFGCGLGSVKGAGSGSRSGSGSLNSSRPGPALSSFRDAAPAAPPGQRGFPGQGTSAAAAAATAAAAAPAATTLAAVWASSVPTAPRAGAQPGAVGARPPPKPTARPAAKPKAGRKAGKAPGAQAQALTMRSFFASASTST